MIKRIIAELLVAVLTALFCGGCIFMNKNSNDSTIESMKAYAEEKYGREFSIESFIAAKDKTYANVLSLSDGKNVFNVFCDEGDDTFDDNYELTIASRIVFDEIMGHLPDFKKSGFDAYGVFLFSDGINITWEYVSQADATKLLNDYNVLKAVLILETNEPVDEHKDLIFSAYKEVLELNPKYIDFEVIEVEKEGEELSQMLNNLLYRYDDDWSRFKEVKAFIGTDEKDIISAEELLGRCE